ncbi:hypothetical protein WR25_03905 isoform B [Diploscapter pachys]|uniref:Bestrophin homolog n=1 Tax=Diploscapter pachys TaxID=2018661 RepID=A0A2A2JMR6_9BILA|nr:hypothetical protein WR25_03905 isoform A [Diploscapter pachys]PAV63015.1 hypothetical protein WR25_03905 isoform B [Diploscapter pachys]
MENEMQMLEQVSTAETYGNYFVPINWSISLLKDLWRNNVFEPLQLNYLFTEMRTFRAHLHDLLHHDEIPVPLAYPQVVFLATRVHFLICLISRQHFVQHEPITEHHYVGMAIVDETFNQRPDLREDIFSDPEYVPMYSEQSMAYNGKGFDMMGSARAMRYLQ